MRLVALPFLFAALTGAACGSPLVVSDRDDVGRDDESIRAYATGASVAFNVRADRPFLDATALEATSSDQSVFVVEDGLGDLVTILTVAAGTAELVFRESGTVVDSRRIVVRDPAAIRLQLEVFAGDDDDLLPAPVTVVEPLHVLRGRETRLVVHTFDVDSVELFGHAVTAVDVQAAGWVVDLGINGPHSALILAPGSDAEAGTLGLRVGGTLLDVVIPCEPRDVEEIERIVLDEGGLDGERGWGRRSVVLAVAEDARGTLLLGNPAWQLEGEDAGIGFALEYKVGVGVPGQELVARLGPAAVSRTIYPEPGTANAIDGGSCAAGDAPVLVAGVVCGGALLLRRRRRA